MSMQKPVKRTYKDGMTKQQFKDDCDISKLLCRAQKAGTLSHLQRFENVYGDFSDFDFVEANRQLARGNTIFNELPSEVRKEFGHNAANFFAFVNDPANVGELRDKLPALAAPGRQVINLAYPDHTTQIQETVEATLEPPQPPPEAPTPPAEA